MGSLDLHFVCVGGRKEGSLVGLVYVCVYVCLSVYLYMCVCVCVCNMCVRAIWITQIRAARMQHRYRAGRAKKC